MTRRRGTRVLLSLLAGLSGAAMLATACADGDEPVVSSVDDGGTLPETAPPVEASVDAGADGDATSRTCSDQGFCHTALPRSETLRAVWGTGDVVWAVSEEGDVLRWDGNAWMVHAFGLGALFAVWGSGGTDLWIGGEKGLYHGTGATPAAVVFDAVPTPGDAAVAIRTIWGRGASDVWAAGGDADDTGAPRSRVLHLAPGDAGAGWTLDPISSEPFALGLVWGDAQSVWLAGDDGTEYSQSSALFRRGAVAGTFDRVSITAFNPEEGPVQGLPGSISSAGAGADGSVVIAGRTLSATPSLWTAGGPPADGGIGWSYDARDLDDPSIRAVWDGAGGATWIAGDYGRVRRRSGTGSWDQAAIMIADFPIIAPLYGIWGTSEDDFWVVGREIAMHRVASAGSGR